MILAGGSGTRLWPLARESAPKQFLPLLGGASLFRRTYERIAPLVGRRNVLVVAGSKHAGSIRRLAPEIPRDNIITEGLGRNTAASIALAAHRAVSRHGDALMVVLPADHWIEPVAAFRSAVWRGLRFLRRTDRLIVIGVKARGAETGFGYIRPTKGSTADGISPVERFIEKPDRRKAARLIRGGRVLWNSGIFLWRAGLFLDELARHSPGIARPVSAWVRRAPRGAWAVPDSVLRRLPALPVDRAVLERSRRIVVVRAGFAWSDIGTWDAYLRLAPRRGARRDTGETMTVGAPNCRAINPAGLTVLVGVSDLVVVRSGSIVLVCHRTATQAVRQAVRRLRGSLAAHR